MHDIETTSNGASVSVPDPSDRMFLGTVSATALTSGVHAISCKEKALLKVSLALSPEGKQTRVLCKIDSGAETNIVSLSLYNQLGPSGGTEIPNLGSCQVYFKGPNNPKPKVIQAEVTDIDRPPITGNTAAQSLNLLKLNWAVTVESNSKSTSQSPKLFDARGKPHPFPLTKEYLLFAVFQAPHTI